MQGWPRRAGKQVLHGLIHAQKAEPPPTEALDFLETPQPVTLGLGRFFLGVLAAETLHAAGGVHQLLLAGEEGMATGANFYVDVALVSRAGGKAVAACAHDADFVVSGMNGCLHGLLTSVPNGELFDSKGRPRDSANGTARDERGTAGVASDDLREWRAYGGPQRFHRPKLDVVLEKERSKAALARM